MSKSYEENMKNYFTTEHPEKPETKADELRAALAATNVVLAHLTKERDEAHATVATLALLADRLQNEKTSGFEVIAKLNGERDETREECLKLRRELDLVDELNTLRGNLQADLDASTKTQHELAKARNEYARERGFVARLQEDMEHTREYIATLKHEFAQAKGATRDVWSDVNPTSRENLVRNYQALKVELGRWRNGELMCMANVVAIIEAAKRESKETP